MQGEGPSLAITKSFDFENYYQTLAFVNAVAFTAHLSDHHPELEVSYKRCVVRFNTHGVGGISSTDFECASAVDAQIRVGKAEYEEPVAARHGGQEIIIVGDP